MALLDIIVTHYNEPWEVGKKFFDLVEHQRCFNHDEISITIVQDGEKGSLPWEQLLSDYCYGVNIVTVPEHVGVAEARNEGIRNTNSDWIMFCDFDDSFSDICSVSMWTNVLPVDVCDVIWGPYYKEERYDNDHTYINEVEADINTVVGKIYRRKALEENNIWFDGRVPGYVDYIFGATILALIPPFRITKLTTTFFTYLKTLRKGSMTYSRQSYEEMVRNKFEMNMVLVDEFKNRGLKTDYANYVVKTVCDEFMTIAELDKIGDDIIDMKRIAAFYREHKSVFDSVSRATREVILSNSDTEAMSMIQIMYNYFGKEYDLVNQGVKLDDWIKKLESVKDNPAPRQAEEKKQTVKNNIVNITKPVEVIHEKDYTNQFTDENRVYADEHVAVYCGTYNTYMNMLTSAKSLLCTTPMDKIYFIIEDDKFPYELPDIIKCINIKKHPLFAMLREDSPNYHNSWSYMCMVRSLFPKMFPEHEKVLSFDIDTVIQDDISDLWDLDMDDYYIAGVCEPERQKYHNGFYVNFGVVMMNLKKLRNDGKDDEIIESLNTQKHGCPEQDAFNALCAGHILPISPDLNVTLFSHITGEPERERILHYAGLKYWRHYEPVKKYTTMSWKDIMKKQGELHG